MNKYKVTTINGEVAIEADTAYNSGTYLLFSKTGDWVEPNAPPVAIRRNRQPGDLDLGYLNAGMGYNKTEYVAGFNNNYWLSYVLVGTAAPNEGA